MSLISDFSAHATCTNTNNCGSDSGAGSGAVFPDITSGAVSYTHLTLPTKA